jgi:flavin-dependent dehydrogenase
VPETNSSSKRSGGDYDAVVVGASLAGCATAIQLGRAGARVALIEKQPDPQAYKRICSHFIQASGVPAIERLGLLEKMEAAGAVRPQIRAWTTWGWVEPPTKPGPRGINLRREVLDPMIREMAGSTAGVEPMLGWAVESLIREEGSFGGVVARNAAGERREVRAPLTVGADGRDSTVAELSGVPVKTYPHGRVVYAGYFQGGAPANTPDATVWFLNPQWAAAFPTDEGLTLYAVMPTRERLPDFKRDPKAALLTFLFDLPEAPPIRDGELVGPVLGKIDMTNRKRRVTAPGLALIGDAALATDPLFGVGCGWAFQSSEWLAESVLPALTGEEPLEEGLSRYRRRYAGELSAHAFFIHDYSNGRRFNPGERMIFSTAARDEKGAEIVDAYATRQIRPQEMLPRMLSRAIAVNARRALAHR